jgi:hypothetical protein
MQKEVSAWWPTSSACAAFSPQLHAAGRTMQVYKQARDRQVRH